MGQYQSVLTIKPGLHQNGYRKVVLAALIGRAVRTVFDVLMCGFATWLIAASVRWVCARGP